MIDADTIRTWRINYGLCRRNPAEAAQWWETKVGHTPSDAVAALGTCIEEVERQAAQIDRMRAALVEAQRWINEDRAAFVACSRPPGGDTHWSEADAAVLERMDELLRMIDKAMGEATWTRMR